MNKVELLAPAGDLGRAKLAIDFNADAVYCGGKLYSLRARADNFDLTELKQIIDYAHNHKSKVYLVTNILCHNEMVKGFTKYLKAVAKLNPDAFICADPYIISTIHKLYPKKEIHVSTQQSICNSKAALFWKKQGASRIITAREIDYQNIKLMCKRLKGIIDVEYFIHGAHCVGYSGHCTMSNNFALRDANVGGCAQSCRWKWILMDKNHKVISNKFIMSAKDICQVKNLPLLLKSGLASFKIEGRMKSMHYIATVVNVYAQEMRDFYAKKLSAKRIEMYEKEIDKAANRPTSFAWFNGKPSNKQMLYGNEEKKLNQNFAFIIDKKSKNGSYEIISKNFFTTKNKFEVFGKNHDLIHIKISKIFDVKNNMNVLKVNRPMYRYIISTNSNKLNVGDIGRISI